MQTFEPFSLTHASILGLLGGATCVAIVAYRRAKSPRTRRGIDWIWGGLNLAWWVLVSAILLLPGVWDPSRSLPLQVCDLSAVLAAVAMLHGARWSRAMLYYVALGLSIWALITPDLKDGPATLAFWAFFIGHGASIGAAVYDLSARGFRPGWGDFGMAVAGMAVWLAVVFPLNAIFGWNYGYVGDSLAGTTNPIHFLGQWPWRVAWLALGVIGLFAVMTLPWTLQLNRRSTGLSRV